MIAIDKQNRLTYPAQDAVTGADAGAGAEAGTITVPAGERWLLLGASVELVQGATQTPWPRLLITDGSTVFAAVSGSTAQAASTTCRHSWFPGAPLAITGATTAVQAQGAIPPDLVLEAGATIATSTVGIGANSNYGVLQATVVKLPAA